MPYEALATTATPALIIYLLDISRSMKKKLGPKTRIETVTDALTRVLEEMTARSMKGKKIASRYRVAIYAYSDDVFDVLGGVKTIDEIVNLGIPELSAQYKTNTAGAYRAAEKLLQAEIPAIQAKDAEEMKRNPKEPALHPAPLVCHMTDGEFNLEDPEPIVQRLMNMSVADGNVLVENIFLSDTIVSDPIGDISKWQGILPDTDFANDYVSKLLRMSSPIPKSYLERMREMAYHLSENSMMLFPGDNPELVEIGFQMSGSTRITPASTPVE
jgi:uncharacterized protein YegL